MTRCNNVKQELSLHFIFIYYQQLKEKIKLTSQNVNVMLILLSKKLTLVCVAGIKNLLKF